MDALLNSGPPSALQPATLPNATFESDALADELPVFGSTGFDPGHADFDDFHSPSTAPGQVGEALPFGTDFLFEYQDELDPFEDLSPRNVADPQTVDTSTALPCQSDCSTNSRDFPGLANADFWQEDLEQGLTAESMVSIDITAASEELVSKQKA